MLIFLASIRLEILFYNLILESFISFLTIISANPLSQAIKRMKSSNISWFMTQYLSLWILLILAANLFEVLVYAYKWHFNNIWWHSWAVNILKYIREFEQIFCDLWAALRLVILEYLSSKYVFEFIRMPLYGVNKHLSCIWCCLSTNTWVE